MRSVEVVVICYLVKHLRLARDREIESGKWWGETKEEREFLFSRVCDVYDVVGWRTLTGNSYQEKSNDDTSKYRGLK